MKKSLCLLLCAVLLLVCLPVTAMADSRYSTISTTGVALEYPADRYYLKTPLVAQVKASKPNGSIYFMPVPKKGNGNLGTVKNGTQVTLLALKSGYYFFSTDDGRVGWNGTKFFTVIGEASSTTPSAPGGRTVVNTGTLFRFANGATVTIPAAFSLTDSSSADRGGMVNTFYYDAARDYSLTLSEITFSRYPQSSRDLTQGVYDNLLATLGNSVTDSGISKDGFWVSSYYGYRDSYYLITEAYRTADALYVFEFYYPTSDSYGWQTASDILSSYSA